MPVTRTAKRALQKSKHKEKRNKVIRAKIKDIVREAKKVAVGEKDTDKKELSVKISKILDKATKKNIIHKNKAARLKSRLAKKLNQVVEAKPKTKKATKVKTKKKKK